MTKAAQHPHIKSVEYPTIPLRDKVFFPHSLLRLKVGRSLSMAALKAALAHDRTIFLVTQRDPSIEEPSPDQLYNVGIIADILNAPELTDGHYKVVIYARERGILGVVKSGENGYLASVQTVVIIPDSDKPVLRLQQYLTQRILDYATSMDERTQLGIKDFLKTSDPSVLADYVAAWLPQIAVADRQKLLETLSPFERLQQLVSLLERKDVVPQAPKIEGSGIFIGHGRSRLWARLQVFLQNDLGLTTLNYESESRVGDSIVPLLEKMLNEARFAILVLTAEDGTQSGAKRARQNVIHEAGLFQGRLGFKKAILLVQEGIEDFSNVAGLQHIPFTGDNIEQTFYELQRVLKREGFVKS